MKLINLNVGIKIDNAARVAEFLSSQNPDFVALQEVMRPLEDSVLPMYRSKEVIESAVGQSLPYKFFGPLYVTEAFRKNGEVHRDFGGFIEQGNELMSKFPIVEATNEHFYKQYSYAIDWTNFKTEDHGRAVQVAEFLVNKKRLQILNLHGIWSEDKMGDERTVEKCRYVVAAARRKKIPTIIVGDFNLLPESNGIKIIDQQFTNLVTKFHIKSTRPNFKDNLESGSNVVDYVFVDDKIKVDKFEVVETDISDHLPLILDFEIVD